MVRLVCNQNKVLSLTFLAIFNHCFVLLFSQLPPGIVVATCNLLNSNCSSFPLDIKECLSISSFIHLILCNWSSCRKSPCSPSPTAKQGKDSKDLNNYRPIALTSCVCKTMEGMINYWLVWYLESSSLITEAQSGFRKTCSTMEYLVWFETFVREGFLNREHVVSIFFDLERHMTPLGNMESWKISMIWTSGVVYPFLFKTLSERKFRVRVGTSLSDFYDQEMGVLQGIILSVTLCVVKINSIARCIRNSVDKSLFVDDFGVSYQLKHMHAIERHLLLYLNRIEDWADNNGFKFSQSKTVCVHFLSKGSSSRSLLSALW